MKPPLAMMLLVAALLGLVPAAPGVASEGEWETKRLHGDFYSEGASTGDIDGDGNVDLVSGPFWWKGPAFEKRFAFYEPVKFDVRKYSDNFFSFVADLDADGGDDVIVLGFPGKEARAYMNPGNPANAKSWPMKVIADQVCHEAPALVDLVPGGLPELVCARDTAYGYYEAGDDATKPWQWRAISAAGDAVKPFGHGMGTGDLDGDGDIDVIERYAWWENPKQPGAGKLWKKHTWALNRYGGGGAQIHVHDVDGDGTNDIVTSLNGHGYGLAWFRQVVGERGARIFERHDIMGESSVENPYGVAFSQLHAVELRDMDGDGLKDIVTGKRWYAHNGKDPGGGQEAVLYWFQCRRSDSGEVQFIPRQVDNDSGVGVEVVVADLNGDARPDIVSANKKGVAIHLQTGALAAAVPALWKVSGGRPDTDYADSRKPVDAARSMEVPAGFTVDLIAAEPDVVQPIAMCFDARGRLWVAEGMSYPVRRPDEEAQDRILIFEDADADGSFETRKVFADKLNLVSGIEIGFGGVWVGAAPYLMFIPDADGDDVPDGEPKILLDGWHYEDTHETLNSFTWGPDGWLYGCHGVFTHSVVGKPGTSEAERQRINAGIWRYHPVRHEFELFAEGTSNPWGVDFDENGDWFATACVIPHFYHVIQGARYFRQGGQHFNPYVYEDIGTIADHVHYGDGTFASARADGKVDRALSAEKASDTSAVGGGHAHCGLAIYLGDQFPAEYRGDFFFHNLHGHRVVREAVEHDGSGFVARHRPDFALAKDHAHIGVGIMLGPDGALYTSDWHDPQTCHHRDVEIWDRTDGRIFRIRHGELKPRRMDLHRRSDVSLLALLWHDNAFQARQAQRILQERAAAGKLDRATIGSMLKTQLKKVPERKLRLRALWTLFACDLIETGDLLAVLEDHDPYLRGWAVHLLVDGKEALSIDAHKQFVKMATEDDSSIVRRYLAAALQRIPEEQRWGLVAALGSRSYDAQDRNIPLLTWYGLEPLVAEDPKRALALVDRMPRPRLREFAYRRAAAFPEGIDVLLARVGKSTDPKVFASRANDFLAAVEDVPNLSAPPSWKNVRAKGESFSSPIAKVVLQKLGTRLGDAESFPYWRAVLRNGKLPIEQRKGALDLLKRGRDPELGTIAASLLKASPRLREDLIAALPAYADEAIAKKVVAVLPEIALINVRNQAVNLLASRPVTARVLLDAIADEQVNSTLVSPVLVRQMLQLKDDQIQKRVKSIWGNVNRAPPDLAKQIVRWRRALTPERLARADKSHGREIFNVSCGTCHQLFGQGVALGPDLTGSNRGDLGYLLENVLAPSSVVGLDYQLNVFSLNDDRIISGIVKREDGAAYTVAMAGGTELAVAKSDVMKREVLPQSLMVPGLFEAFPEKDVADLVAYLQSPQQVPLSSEKGAAPVAAHEPGGPLEGEALVASANVSAGKIRPQPMGNFPGGTWSNGSQLFWTGGKPGAVLNLAVPAAKSGVYNLAIHLTKAKDYAKVRIIPSGHEAREIDLFDPTVGNAEPVVWNNVKFEAGKALPVKIEIVGANAEAVKAFMVGLDRVVLDAAKVAKAPKAQLDGTSRSSRLPNLIVIFCDDMGYADIGPFGAKGYKTPHLDRMAREGMKFTDFHVGRSVCSPSRAALMTGCYPVRVGVPGNFGPHSTTGLNPDEITIAEIAKSKGYATACFGKWHLGHLPQFLPTSQGFDEYYGLPYSNDMWPYHPAVMHLPMEERLKRWPHLPLLEGKKVVKPAITPEDQKKLTTQYAERAVKFIEKHKDEPFFIYLPHAQPHVPLFVSDKFEGKSKRGVFGDVISEIDWSVGQILEALKANGIDDNTMVVFTSDNGPWLSYGDHAGSAGPLRNGKGSIYEGGFRVPCVMRWPGKIPAGSVCDQFAATIDILPTFAALAGAEVPKDRIIDGKDIRPLLFGKKGPRRDFYYYAGSSLGCVRSGKWKLILAGKETIQEPGTGGNPGKGRETKPVPLSLFDLEGEVGEQTNLAAKHPEVVARLQKLVAKARADLGDGNAVKGKNIRPVGGLKGAAPKRADAKAQDKEAEPPVVPPRKGVSEVIELFNGKDLDGWIGHEKYWSVENGEIVGRNTEPIAVSTYLLTKRKFTDFRLTFEFKLAQAEMHSGLAMWGRLAPEEGDEYTYAGHLVMFPSNYGFYDLYGRRGIHKNAAVAKPAGKQHDWNTLEILAQGNRIRFAVNGVLASDWREPEPDRINAAPIGLQLHSNKVPQEVRWRKLKVETFPKDDGMLTVKGAK